MFKSIKNRVFIFFSIFSLISLLIVTLNLYQIRLTNATIDLNKNIDSIHIKILDEFNCFNDFFSIELINPSYYSTHKSQYISKKDSLNKQVKFLLDKNHKIAFMNIDVQTGTKNISEKIDTLNQLFNRINQKLLKRGFKDYGKEGEMRYYIHIAEKSKYIDMVTLLTLRRSEKDYIIRNEQKYITNLNNQADKYLSEIEGNRKIPDNEKDSLINLISNYKKSFNELVQLDKYLGIKDFSGLRKQFKNQQDQVLSEFLVLKNKINFESKSRLNTYRFYYFLITVVLISLSIVLSFIISRVLTKRITKLSLYIKRYVNSDFKNNDGLNIQSKDDEIGNLISNFEILKLNLSNHIHNLEEIVQERTIQIKKKNADIISSINYAKNIQEALLPDKKYFEKFFPESLVYYKPRSIVSGDFYWFKRFEDKNISVVAVADCTGHGVPGAMMSMLGIAFLNEVVVRESVTCASEILTALSLQVIEHLSNQKSPISDGMDISILVFFHNKKIVQFAGAKRDLLFFRDKEFSVYKGDRHTIGKSFTNKTSFTNYEFEVKENDIFYLVTDGFQDQLGADSKRTLQKSRVYDFFKEVSHLSFKSQLNLIDKYISFWQKDEPQTDDILIIGFKYFESIFQNRLGEIALEQSF